jgi:predicted DNA-binding transcriptional regulator AlpA
MNQISKLDKKLRTPHPEPLLIEAGSKGSHKKSNGPFKQGNETRGGMIVDLPAAQPLPPALIYVTASEAAGIRRQGTSTFWRQVKEGQVPPPFRVSPRRPRWLLEDILPRAARSQAGGASEA